MMGDEGVGDGDAVCFRLISLFLSVCWLEKLILSHGAFDVLDLVMYRTYDRNKCSAVVTELLVLAFVFYSHFL